jgi:hypothetical protein
MGTIILMPIILMGAYHCKARVQLLLPLLLRLRARTGSYDGILILTPEIVVSLMGSNSCTIVCYYVLASSSSSL